MTCVNGAAPLGLSLENITVSEDGKAVTRGIAVGIGSPQQILALSPSISDDNIWVFNAADCVNASNSTCIGQKGGVYNAALSHTYRQTTEAAWNGSDQVSEFEHGSYIFFNDDLYFGSDGSSDGFPYFMNQPGQGSRSGLGIGNQSVFLDTVVKSGQAPSKNFGIWVGSRSVTDPADGALWIGGYDVARVADTFTTFPILNEGYCVGCVIIKNLTYLTSDGPVSLFSNPGETLQVGLNPFTHGLEVPPSIFQNFLRASKGTVGTDPGTTVLITLPTDADLGSISVTLSNGYTTVIPSYEMFLPPRQYDAEGIYGVSNDTYLISEFVNTTTTGNYLPSWGTPFLTMNYMIMNYENQTFSLATAYQGSYSESNRALIEPLCEGVPPSSTTAGGPTPITTPSSPSSSTAMASVNTSHTNVGAIAGGVVGGVLGLAIIGLLAFCLLRSRRRERALREENESVITNYVGPHDTKSQATSQVVPSSPTEVSEADQKNISQWLYAQDHMRTMSPSTEPNHLSSSLAQPFEMPADHRHV